jgi:F-type H+-transporting ATPase subunit c
METTAVATTAMNLLPLVAIGLIGPGIGMGLIGLGAMNALGRNPSASKEIAKNMILALVFCEFAALLGFGLVFLAK